jgi:hypothetical protein
MLTKTKLALAAALLTGSASIVLAQYDGDGNAIPGAHQRGAIVEKAHSFDNAYAATYPTRAQGRQRQLDGDGNPVPGSVR